MVQRDQIVVRNFVEDAVFDRFAGKTTAVDVNAPFGSFEENPVRVRLALDD